MNKNTGIIIGVIIVAIFAGAIYASTNKDERETGENIDESQNMEDKMMDEGIKDDEMADEEDAMMKTGSYEAYGAEKLAKAETGDVVLFFHASWCPSCRALNSNIESNRESIPEGVTILKTDYDEETELKKKYGITYQHTLVQVDRDGNMIKKWSGSPSLDSLLSQIQ